MSDHEITAALGGVLRSNLLLYTNISEPLLTFATVYVNQTNPVCFPQQRLCVARLCQR